MSPTAKGLAELKAGCRTIRCTVHIQLLQAERDQGFRPGAEQAAASLIETALAALRFAEQAHTRSAGQERLLAAGRLLEAGVAALAAELPTGPATANLANCVRDLALLLNKRPGAPL